ncbi:EAL domain-containing protein [Xanthobacter autotrophicus]|uniref:putative bifunctional diguanylate cyclase/phosphodiesterase n=1 Tax=Xanthobacter TaxID=279 RepID=UPI0024AB2661|nr:EAL domain-containing protein [Xanthobacter autotrophicus]MDI4666139.1 EAL domain-containing protein [Xanthobacter autotrophicus]
MAGLVTVFVLAGLRQDDKARVRERTALLASLRAREAVMAQALVTTNDEQDTLKHLVSGDFTPLHRSFGLKLHDGFGFEFVYITDARGNVIYSSERGQQNQLHAFSWIRPAIQRALAEGQKAALSGVVASQDAAGLMVARPFDEKVEGLDVAQPLVAITVDVIDPDFLRMVGGPASLDDVELIQHPHGGERKPGVFVPNLYDGSEAELVWRSTQPGSRMLWGLMPAAVVLTSLLAVLFLVLMVRARRMAAALIASEAKARALAARDYLTGLLNRGAFIEALDAAIAGRRNGETLALLFVDLDDFKEINDRAGHAAGDDLLRAVARRLEEALGEGTLVARFGGDEFVAALRCREDGDLDRVVERLFRMLEPPVLLEQGGELGVSASVGAARVPQDAATGADLMRLADVALYKAKADGAGLFRLFEPGFEQAQIRRRHVEAELAAALDKGEIKLVYQPQVDVESERIVGFEVLARWDHPIRGRILPGEFMPVAESSRLMGRFDTYVLRLALVEARALPGVTLSVNMSALNLRNGAIFQTVAEALAETGFDPARLEIEITESAILDAAGDTQAALEKLRDMGVRLALDDFGTGHASLVHVRRFPITKLKIDKSFILNLGTDRDASAIVEYVVRLGRSLGITLTAEGVETREQLRFLRAFGAQQAQGYLFAPPLPLVAAAAMLERQQAAAHGVAAPDAAGGAGVPEASAVSRQPS